MTCVDEPLKNTKGDNDRPEANVTGSGSEPRANLLKTRYPSRFFYSSASRKLPRGIWHWTVGTTMKTRTWPCGNSNILKRRDLHSVALESPLSLLLFSFRLGLGAICSMHYSYFRLWIFSRIGRLWWIIERRMHYREDDTIRDHDIIGRNIQRTMGENLQIIKTHEHDSDISLVKIAL